MFLDIDCLCVRFHRRFFHGIFCLQSKILFVPFCKTILCLNRDKMKSLHYHEQKFNYTTFDDITDILFPTKNENEHFTSTFLSGLFFFCRFHYLFGHFRTYVISVELSKKNCNRIKWDRSDKKAEEKKTRYGCKG